jgi:transposase
MKAPPEEVKLSREESEALIERIQASSLAGDDQRLLVKLIQVYFWLTVALRETKISLTRLKRALFGEGQRPPPPPSRGGPAGGVSPGATVAGEAPTDETLARRVGHGRRGADVYTGAQQVVCRQEAFTAGPACPACGRGTLYPLPTGVEIRIDGNALLSAVRYELEKLRCSACGEVFTAPMPAMAGTEKYSPRARAVIALGRYYLGLPFYRIEQYQALVGVPVAEATLWELAERVADCAWPVFDRLWELAAQGEVIYQDDPHVRILARLAENRRADATGEPLERRGMYTTGLVATAGGQVICLYRAGRAHAGDNLTELLARREAGLEKPLVMSDALAANQRDDDDSLIRCHCLAHGRRQFTDLEEVFPAEARQVITILNQGFEHAAVTRDQAMPAAERLAYHQAHSGPLLASLHAWLGHPFQDHRVEPNSSLGKALSYLLSRWETLTQFLRVPGAPIDSNTVERALKLIIRQRKNSLFYASTHSAYVATGQPDRHWRAGWRQCAGVPGRLTDPSLGRVPPAGGMAALELPGQLDPGLGHLAPIVRHRRLRGAAVPQQYLQFAGRQAPCGAVRPRPPLQPPRGEALGAQPVTLPVITEQLEGGAGAITENVDRSIERILGEGLSAHRRQPINAFAKIDRSQGQKDPTLRRELQPQADSRNARSTVTSGGGAVR